jgi:hypothetical protein
MNAGDYMQTTSTLKTPKIAVMLTKEEAKNLIGGFGYFADDSAADTRYSKEEREEITALLGRLNCEYKEQYGEWAF